MVLLGKPKSIKTIPSYLCLKLIYLVFNTWYKDDLLKHSKMLYEKCIWDLMHKKTYTLSINRQRMTKTNFTLSAPHTMGVELCIYSNNMKNGINTNCVKE